MGRDQNSYTGLLTLTDNVTGDGNEYTLQTDGNGTTLASWTEPSNEWDVWSGNSLSVNVWAHLAIRGNGTNWAAYLDGSLLGTQSHSAFTPSGFIVGWNGADERFQGRMAAIKLFDSALSADQIAIERRYYRPVFDAGSPGGFAGSPGGFWPCIDPSEPDIYNNYLSGNDLIESGTLGQADGPPIMWAPRGGRILVPVAGGGTIVDASWSSQVDLSDSSPTVLGTILGSLSAAVDLADDATETAVALDDISESVELAESLGVTVLAFDSISDAVEFASAMTGTITALRDVLALVELTDSTSALTGTLGLWSGALEVLETQQATIIALGDASHEVELSDAQATIATALDDVNEQVDLGESISSAVAGDVTGEIGGTLELLDAQGSVAQVAAAITEAAEFGSAFAVIATIIASTTDPVDLQASLSGGSLIPASISGDVSLADLYASEVSARGSISGDIDLGMVQDTVLASLPALTENVDLTATIQQNSNFQISYGDAVELAEQMVAVSGEIAGAVQILARARDTLITVGRGKPLAEERNRAIIAEPRSTLIRRAPPKRRK